MTSGNLSGKPPPSPTNRRWTIYDIADGFCLLATLYSAHGRLCRTTAAKCCVVRGDAVPDAIYRVYRPDFVCRRYFCRGSENTFCLVREQAVVSQHLGDLSDDEGAVARGIASDPVNLRFYPRAYRL